MNEFVLTLKSILFKSSERTIFFTFLSLCILGGILLFLPVSGTLSFIDALFLSFSGVCVTGLSVVDISQNMTLVGQFILLLLIQAGGLSIMSISSIIFLMLGRRMSLSYERNARSIFNADSREDIKKSLFLIFKYTFIVECTGMFILFLRFLFINYNVIDALKNSIFIAVSAFCNAGFTLFSENLVKYSDDPIILFTTSFLIILGGIAPALAILFPKFLKMEKLSPMLVIVFNTTIALLVVGCIIYFIAEYNNTLQGMSLIDKIANSWFQSVTTRTAGFNSVDLSNINDITYALFLFLMVIGGSPGGMAGGIKTTTFGILIITCLNTLCGQKNIVRNKIISPELINKAITLITVYLSIIVICTIILMATQTISNKKLLFEVVSAMGTVGLSMGITPYLDIAGKIVIILTMFLGRILPAILVCYLTSKTNYTSLDYPKAEILLT